MKLTGIPIKGMRLSKDGKLVKTVKHLDVSARLRQRGSKKVRVGKQLCVIGPISVTEGNWATGEMRHHELHPPAKKKRARGKTR